MVDVNNSLSPVRDLIKRFADDLMQVSDTINCDDLVALADALDRLKTDVEQKISTEKATQASMESDWQSTHTGSPNQGIRRSHRITPAHRFASAGSLLVTEHDTESESSNKDNIPSTMLHKTSLKEHITINAASGISFKGPALLLVHYENQAPIEELVGTELPRESHPIEQIPPSRRLYTTRPVANGPDKRTEVQLVQVIDGASNAQAHQPPGTDAPYQAAEHLDYTERPESLHQSLVNRPHLDAAISPFRLGTQVQTDGIFVPILENFEPGALREALLQQPSEINRGRYLRILQCVNEIASPYILDSLKLACARKDELFPIPIYLDEQENQSHILVARARYIKYNYFETYLRAVEALKKEKRNSNREKRRVSARKQTASFRQGIFKELPPTPCTEEIHRVYGNLSPSARKRRAEDMVKDEIFSKVEKVYRGNKKRLRRSINKYIKQGRVLHHILQGRKSLDPGLLILFPSFGANPPSLGMAEFGLKLEELEEKTLSKPIEMKDIDNLTLVEAAWFGEVLQARTDLLEQVPKTVLDLISNSLTKDLVRYPRA